MFTIAHDKADGTVETEHLYEKQQTAELAATWRSKKRNEKWYALIKTEGKDNVCTGTIQS
jgi:hypothetical protein